MFKHAKSKTWLKEIISRREKLGAKKAHFAERMKTTNAGQVTLRRKKSDAAE
jgi:hypothetical protein